MNERRRKPVAHTEEEAAQSAWKPPITKAPATINELCDRAQAWADEWYQLPSKTGERVPTGEAENLKHAMRALRAVHGEDSPLGMCAEWLEDAQAWMIHRGLARSTINDRIRRIRLVFHWASKPGQRWVPRELWEDLRLLDGVRWGRTAAKETMGVPPVAWEHVVATMAAVAPRQRYLYAMIELQWLTGMRPNELCRMERDELVVEHASLITGETLELLVYKPGLHKGRHRGLPRNIFLPPEARRIVEDWLRVWPEKKLWPMLRKSYAHAIRDICIRERIPHWFPLQIRHSFATRMRTAAGIDVVQVLMGHKHRSTTEIYALPDCSKAISAIFQHA